MQTFRFNQLTLKADQLFDLFPAELHSRAKSCNFTDTDGMVRYKIVFRVKAQLSKHRVKAQWDAGGCHPPGKKHYPTIKHFGVNHSPINNDRTSFTSA